ncbi:MAG TPA: acryloyl-CoA reductase [Pseudolysinimonas sp.]|jgi:acrylyl-CoA reductase (NADPH)|nr:acryloyl-CoA reductase [Pseudolysinimonas sp.]
MRAIEVIRGERGRVVERAEPAGDGVLVDVTHSSLNYKDALAITGRPGVIRAETLIAGIDLVGTRRDTGARVLVNGRGLGETHDGGFAETARVPEEWLVPVPDRFTNAQAAALGTAGYTAALCVLALREAGALDGDVVVTGATGGVGSIALVLLHAMGVRTTAVTGKPERDYLARLGAASVIDRAELEQPGKPLQEERWSGAIDTAGGPILANLLSQTRYGGTVAACGLAAAPDLHASMMPFILRAVSLVGINSVYTPVARRDAAWRLLDEHTDLALLDALTASVPLDAADAAAERILAGQNTGRVVVDVRA